MAEVLFANNATTTLAGSINSVATSCNLAPGSGTLFPNPTGGDYFIMTFTDSATGLVREIVHCTARSGDTLTIVRAQEGTTAQAWSAGDLAEALVTAGALQAMIQQETLATQGGLYLQDSSGAANDIAFTLPSYITSLSQIAGALIRVKAANANTGGSTVSPVGFSSTTLVNPDGSDLLAGQILVDSILTIVYEATNDVWFVQSISSAPVPGRTRVAIASGASNYVVPNNVGSWTVIITGGGGGAGGADASNAGAGGGAGGTAIRNMSPAATGGSRTIAYSVGAGGTGGAPGANGTAGGNTTVTCGSISMTANGGGYGEYDTTPAGGEGGGGSGTGSLVIKGGAGTDGSPGATLYGGNGGASYWGGGGRSATSNSASVQNGAAVGSGGGSGYGGGSISGGAGKEGIVVIEWGA